MGKGINFQVFVVVSSILGVSITSLVFFVETSELDKKSLAGVNMTVDNYFRWSIVGLIFPLFLAIVLIFVRKSWTRIVSAVIFASFFVHACYSLISLYKQEQSIINGYSYVFDQREYLRKGSQIQEKMNCCGWENASLPIDETVCNYLVACKDAIQLYYSSRKAKVVLSMVFVVLCYTFSVYGSIKLIEEIKKPIPQYEELMLGTVE